MATLNGSLTFSTLSNSTLTICPTDLLHSPDIDRLDDVAGGWVDRHRAARALPFHAFGSLDQALAIGLPAGLLERFIDDMHAIKRAGGEHVRIASEAFFVAL